MKNTKLRIFAAFLLTLSLLFAAPVFAAGIQENAPPEQTALKASGGGHGHPAAQTNENINGFIASAAALTAGESGYLPVAADETAINDEDYAARRKLLSALAAPPATYDARTAGSVSYVSTVKNQTIYGACWAFASLASAEGSVVRNGLASPAPSFSPYRNVFSAYNSYTYANAGFSDSMNGGGNSYYATAALSKWFGPTAWSAADDALFPYAYPDDGTPATSANSIDPANWANLFTSQYHLQDAIIFPSPRDSDGTYDEGNVTEIKNAIMQYGPLFISFYDDSSSGSSSSFTANGSDCAYYSADPDAEADHAVTVVGWNDAFSKANFTASSSLPEADGAWLVKNSWGPDWGDQGYFWLSYYEPSIGTSTYFNMAASNNYDNQYYYDDLGFIGCVTGFPQDKEYMSNVFTVAAGAPTQLLAAASINSVYPGTTYEISAYKNPTPGNPTSGTQLDISSDTASNSVKVTELYAGYHTVPFTQTAALNAGDTYSIVVEVDKLEQDDFAMTVECTLESGDDVKNQPLIKSGQSYYSEDGENWADFSDGINSGIGNFSIRAFTVGNVVTGVTISGAPAAYRYKAADAKHTVQLSASVAPEESSNQDVTWSARGPARIDKTGLLTFTGAEGTVSVTAKSVENPAISAAASITVMKNVTGIRTPLSTVYLKRGTSYKLPILLDDGKVTVTGGYTCTSANTKAVATSGGKLIALGNIKKKTKTSVTIKANNGKTKKITVYVVPKAKAVKSFSVSGMPKTMKKGATKQLTVKIKTAGATNVGVTYTSSKKSVMTVDKAGRISAVKKGSAYVTVKAGSKKIKKKITVK